MINRNHFKATLCLKDKGEVRPDLSPSHMNEALLKLDCSSDEQSFLIKSESLPEKL